VHHQRWETGQKGACTRCRSIVRKSARPTKTEAKTELKTALAEKQIMQLGSQVRQTCNLRGAIIAKMHASRADFGENRTPEVAYPCPVLATTHVVENRWLSGCFVSVMPLGITTETRSHFGCGDFRTRATHAARAPTCPVITTGFGSGFCQFPLRHIDN
jgi:hypothetical protein